MSIEKNTGDMVAGALALGMVLNQKSDEVHEASYWHSYALSLQLQLNMQRQLSSAQDRVIAEKEGQLEAMSDELKATSQLLKEAKLELAKQISYKSINAKELNVAFDNLKSLRGRLVSQSAQTHSIYVLYEKLVDEIYALSDPNRFVCLRVEEREKIIEQARTDWEKIGRLTYDMRFKLRS